MNDRDERLLRLMDAAVPAVNDPGDWDEISLRAAATAPRPKRTLRLVPAALGIAALMTVVAVLLVQATDTGKVEPSGPQPGEPLNGIEFAEGERLARDNGCLSCHGIDGQGSSDPGLGPDLSNEGLRNRGVQWQIDHLRDPTSKTPRSTMPPYTGLNDTELTAIAEYLESLGKAPEVPGPLMYSILDRPLTADDTWPDTYPVPSYAGAPRLALMDGGFRYFVAPANEDHVCLVRANEQSRGLQCRPAQSLPDRTGWLLLDEKLAAVIPDGFEVARTSDGEARVVSNVLILEPALEELFVVLSGPAGSVRLPIPMVASSNTPTVPGPQAAVPQTPQAGPLTTPTSPPPPTP